MAMRRITSKDPRKKAIVEALKKVSGFRRITMVQEDTANKTFVGHCFNLSSNRNSRKLPSDLGQPSGVYVISQDDLQYVDWFPGFPEYYTAD